MYLCSVAEKEKVIESGPKYKSVVFYVHVCTNSESRNAQCIRADFRMTLGMEDIVSI